MVTVIVTTYNPTPDAPRFDYARRCVEALHANLRPGPFEIHLTDDGSPDTRPLAAMVASHGIVVSTGTHNGIGASLNRALRRVDGPWMYTTDDWLLTEPLDLELPLWLLEQGYDLVRLGPIHPNLNCKTQFTAGHGWWLDVGTSNGFAFATRPFLAASTLVDKCGPFLEGVDAYECERNYSDRVTKWRGFARVAAINLAGPWEHIGEYEVGDRPIEQLFQTEKVGP